MKKWAALRERVVEQRARALHFWQHEVEIERVSLSRASQWLECPNATRTRQLVIGQRAAARRRVAAQRAALLPVEAARVNDASGRRIPRVHCGQVYWNCNNLQLIGQLVTL